MKDFSKFDYLKSGTPTQQNVYNILNNSKILEKLKMYNPKIVGSVPLEINIPNSDVDIICCFLDKNCFIKDVELKFNMNSNFTIDISNEYGEETITIRFHLFGFQFEIFAQKIKTDKQLAYRLLLIENKILLEYGQEFTDRIIALKKLGLKTEPAFCKLLGISGNPYLELLKLEKK